MNVGELFVNLGIKGTEKTVGALGSVKQGLSNVSSLSIEAKAGLLGAMYAFQRLTAASGQMGTNLTNFTALTGLSAQSLQQWQYAARQAGVSGEEMASSMKGVQSAMTNMLLTGALPSGMGAVASKVGFDANRARDTQYVLQQLQKYAQVVPADLARSVIGSFGVGEGVTAGMIRNKFRPDVLARAPTYSKGEVDSLDKANIAWSNLGNKIEMAFGHFNAKHGGQLVRDISKITDEVLKLADAFLKLADRLKGFQGIAKTFEGWGKIFSGLNYVIDGLSDPKKSKEIGDSVRSLMGPVPLGVNPSPSPAPQNIQIQQNLNFQHEGKDATKTGDSVKKSVQGAFRQIPSGHAN